MEPSPSQAPDASTYGTLRAISVPAVALPRWSPAPPATARAGASPCPPPLAGRIPLGGWLFLGWGPSLTLVPVGGVELLARLAQRRAWQTLVSDPAVVLALASLPAYDLVRPADWSVLDATCALIASMSTSQSPDVPDRVAGSAA
jgi:hypothetical protein